MPDLIDRQAAIDLAKDICVPTKDGSIYRHRCIDPDAIRELPTAQPQRKSAYLIAPHPYGKCSNCGQLIDIRDEYNYCPNCGADMRGE